MWLMLAFIIVPLIEIGLFIKVGGWLTLWPTLAIVFATAVIGSVLVRFQGLRVLMELRTSLVRLRDPLSPLAHGALILFAGALLLTPGFFTDGVGFLLLVPAIRRVIIAQVVSRVVTVRTAARPAGQDVIDGEYQDLGATEPGKDPAKPRANNPPSGWTKH
jgi:UPF0716 protein FxsA